MTHEQDVALRCLHCGQQSAVPDESPDDKPPKPVVVSYYKKSHSVSYERHREEQREAKREIINLKEELTRVREQLKQESSLRKRAEHDLNKAEEQFEKYKKDVDKVVAENERERLKDNQDIIKLEKAVRSAPITREDFQCLMDSNREQKEQNKALIEMATDIKMEISSLRDEKTQLQRCVMAHESSNSGLKQRCAHLEQEKANLISQLQHNHSRCQQQASVCERILKEHEDMCTELTRYKQKCAQMAQTIADLLDKQKAPQQKCAQMAQTIADLELQLDKQKAQFKKLSLNKHMAQQQDTEHDQLNTEYDELWSNPDIILEGLEKHFDETFDAKCFLTDIFMETYKKSKRYLLRFLHHNMDELYKLQSEARRAELEGLSRAYGLLLHSSGAKTLVTKSEAVKEISEEIKRTLEQLPRFSEVRGTLKTVDLPLDRVVEVAWKFVTQACPIIVCQPKACRLDDELHRTSFDHWDENQDDSKPFIYARPVVYRSYHGVVLNRALVGNV